MKYGKQKNKNQKTSQICRESGEKKDKNTTNRVYRVFCDSHPFHDALDGKQVLAATFLLSQGLKEPSLDEVLSPYGIIRRRGISCCCILQVIVRDNISHS